LNEAQRGLAFAAFLKLLIPLFVVIPGIVAFVLFTQPAGTAIIDGVKESFQTASGTINYDKAYPWLISKFIPIGLKGLVLAALTAAIVSSLASMLNSTSTIFTLDIYKPYFKKNATEKQLVGMGRLAAGVALVIAVLLAPVMGYIKHMFQYIQEYTGLVSPGILGVFLMGLFWKKATNKGAIVGVLLSILVAFLLKTPALALPFMDQMFYTLIITMAIIAGVSLVTSKDDDDAKAISLPSKMFKTDSAFNICAYAILILLVVLYALFW